MENINSTEKRIRDLIGNCLGTDVELTPNLAIKDDLNASPEEFLELVTELEKEFDITITPEDRQRMGTVGKITQVVKDLLNELD